MQQQEHQPTLTKSVESAANQDLLSSGAVALDDQRKSSLDQSGTKNDVDNSSILAPVAQLAGIANPVAPSGEQADTPSTNNTGLPDSLKSGVEQLSGHSMDDVQVHYNSAKPAQLQAHAYAAGNQIHVSQGQEKHLAHEAWHVVQQKQGRVAPTMQQAGVNINDDKSLETEADVMGAKALQLRADTSSTPAMLRAEQQTVLVDSGRVEAVVQGVFTLANGQEMPDDVWLRILAVLEKVENKNFVRSRFEMLKAQALDPGNPAWATVFDALVDRYLNDGQRAEIAAILQPAPIAQQAGGAEDLEDEAVVGAGVESAPLAEAQAVEDLPALEDARDGEIDRDRGLVTATENVRGTKVPNASRNDEDEPIPMRRNLDALAVLLETGMNVCTTVLDLAPLGRREVMLSANDRVGELEAVFNELTQDLSKVDTSGFGRYLSKVQAIREEISGKGVAAHVGIGQEPTDGGAVLHGEMRVVQSLLSSGLLAIAEAGAKPEGEPLELYLSISKKGCAMCAATLMAINQSGLIVGPNGKDAGRPVRFTTRGTHGNAYPGWASPAFLLKHKHLLVNLIGHELADFVFRSESPATTLDTLMKELITSVRDASGKDVSITDDPTLSDSEDEGGGAAEQAPTSHSRSKKKKKKKKSHRQEPEPEVPSAAVQYNSKKRATEFYKSGGLFELFPNAAVAYYKNLGRADGKKGSNGNVGAIGKSLGRKTPAGEAYYIGYDEGRKKTIPSGKLEERKMKAPEGKHEASQ